VNGVFNAAMVRGDLADDTLYYGRGAGRAPTASTVVGDIGDIARNIAHGETRYARAVPSYGEGKTELLEAGEVTSRFYIRFMVADKAGSLGAMTTVLGKHGVSISTAMQTKGSGEAQGFVPVVMLTHPGKAADLEAALEEIKTVGILASDPVRLRML
jgi:homoserine dehydrogenase